MVGPTPSEIRAARKKCGLTQACAAELAGYASQQAWDRVERGQRDMDAWRWLLFRHRAGIEALPFQHA